MESLICTLKAIAPLSDNDCLDILKIVKTKELEKGELWIEAGKANNMVAFIDQGYLRKYYIKNGNEVTDFFYFENDFCADLPSIIGHEQPLSNIIAMKETRITTFAYNDFNELSKKSHTIEHLMRVIVESAFIRFYNRTVSFILNTPGERYEQLLLANPTVLQRAAQYHIASYLGISPQHLSRIRGKK